MNTFRIAVVQQDGNPGRPEENCARALRHATEALEGGAEVVLFHEALMAGYVNSLRELAEPVDGPATKAFARLLQGTDSLVIYGLTERDGDQYYVSAPVVSSDGVIANYRKTHLWWAAQGIRNESTQFSPGDRLVTFEHHGVQCGLMICYDGDFPEMTRSYANLGCSVVFWMNNRNERGHRQVRHLSSGNSMIIASACCCGKDERGHPCRGGSNITDSDGSLLSELWDTEGVIFADVNPARAIENRADNPWYRGRRPEIYV